jgi:hypothetical protein
MGTPKVLLVNRGRFSLKPQHQSSQATKNCQVHAVEPQAQASGGDVITMDQNHHEIRYGGGDMSVAICWRRLQSRSTRNQSDPTPNALNQETKMQTMSGVVDHGQLATQLATTGLIHTSTKMPNTTSKVPVAMAMARVAGKTGSVVVQFAPPRSCRT